MFGFSSLLAILQLGLMLAFMPRSPRWLMTQKRRAEAESVLLKIRSNQVTMFIALKAHRIGFGVQAHAWGVAFQGIL